MVSRDGTWKMMDNPIRQLASDPHPLRDLLLGLSYRPGWTTHVEDDMDRGQGSVGMTLVITTLTIDSYDHENKRYRVRHLFPIPPASYNMQSWRRWLLEQFILVERHEACEFFKIGGKRPYAPHHGPGHDPYTVFERGTDEEARTMYTGEVREAAPLEKSK